MNETESVSIPEMLTTEQAAIALHKRPQTLRAWSCHGSGPITPIRIGKRSRLLWKKTDVVALLNGSTQAADQKGNDDHETVH